MQFRFLVVDDAGFLREIIKNVLQELGGHCVGEAANGDEALPIIFSVQPDLVVLDMVMPQRNGMQTIAMIKERHPEIKVLGCSTIDQEEIIKKALAAGFDAYVTKPFTKEDLKSKVDELFQR